MSGDGLLILGLAALAVYTGVHWGRARRAVSDARLGRRRIGTPRQAAARERGHVLMSAAVAMAVLLVTARYG